MKGTDTRRDNHPRGTSDTEKRNSKQRAAREEREHRHSKPPRPTTSKTGRRAKRGRPHGKPHETEMGEASKPTIGAGNDEARRDGIRDAGATRGGKPTPTGRSKEPHQWDDQPTHTLSSRRGQAGKERRADRTRLMRQGGKQARRRKRTGQGNTWAKR